MAKQLGKASKINLIEDKNSTEFDSYFVLQFPDPVLQIDPDSLEIMNMNLRATILIGNGIEENMPGNLNGLFDKNSISNVLLHLEEANKNGKHSFKTSITLNGASLPVDITFLFLTRDDIRSAYLIIKDISEALTVQKEYEFRLGFQKLITSISYDLHKAPLESIDESIELALGTIGIYTSADRALIYLFKNDGALADNTHEWVKKGYPSIKPWRQNVSSDEFPWLVNHLRKFETVLVLDSENLPNEAATEREMLNKMGIRSSCATPIRVGDNLIGMMALNSREYQKHWNSASLELMELLTQVFANALTRREDMFKIIHLNQKLLNTSRIAQFGTWQWDVMTGKLLWSENYYEILGIEPYSQLPNLDVELKVIHPSERKRWMESIEHAILNHTSYKIKTRLQLENNVIKHVLVTGEGEYNHQGLLIRLSGAMIDITEQEKSNIELRESQEKFQNLVETMGEGLIYVDKEGIVLYANEAISTMIGYRQEELLGKRDIDFMFLENDIQVMLNRSADRLRGISEKYEMQLVSKSRGIIWARISASPVYNTLGEVIGSQGVIMDITDQKNLEISLMQEREKWKSLVENIPDYVGTTDLDYNITFINRSFKHASTKELFGKSIMEVVDPFFRKRLKELLDTLKITREPTGLELTLTDKFGIQHWFITHYSPVVVKNKVDSIIAIASEITALKEIEASLRKSNEKWRSLFDNAPDLIVIMNADMKIQVQNTMAEHYWPVEDAKRNFIRLFQENESEPVSKAINLLKKSGERQVVEVCQKSGENSICFVLRFSLVNKSDLNGDILVIATDITKRKEAEQKLNYSYSKLRELTEHLERVRNDEKKRISMEIHDGLGQELTAIKLDLHWLQELVQKNLDESDTFSFIDDKLDSLISKTGHTIESMRRISYQLMPVILDKMGLEPALEWLVRGYKDKNKINCRLTIDLKEIRLHNDISSSVYRIVQEALTNIVKHSKATSVTIRLITTKKTINLTIRDNGIGISQKDIEKTGSIGLFSIQERIRSLNGEIKIEGSTNRGTIINIKIPIKISSK